MIVPLVLGEGRMNETIRAVCCIPNCKMSNWVSTPFCSEHLIEAVTTIVPHADRALFWDSIEHLIKTLPYREREIVKLYYGFGDGYTYNSSEIGRIFKLTQARVDQLKQSASQKMNKLSIHTQLAALCKKYFEFPTSLKIQTDAPSIIIQNVVEYGEKTDEGTRIEAVSVPWLMIAKMIERDQNIIYQIDARKWEELIAGWYTAAGYDEVILTPRSGDFGRDVIATKHDVKIRVIDQVKAYKPGHLVTANDVRALLGVLSNDRNASKGYVTTTSDFAPMVATDPSVAPNVPYRLELINGVKLIDRICRVSKKDMI